MIHDYSRFIGTLYSILYLETDQRQTKKNGGVTRFSFRNLHNLRALTHLDPGCWVYFFTNKYNKHVFCKNNLY